MLLWSCGTKQKTVTSPRKSAIITQKAPQKSTSSAMPKNNEVAETSKSIKNNSTNTPADANKQEVLEATSIVKITPQGVLDYINAHKETAMQNMRDYKIPASITLAQGILESGAGTARLSRLANNHFGIKCHSEWTGETITHDDDAKDECFRKYQQASESFRDHAIFLSTRRFYVSLFSLPIDDYKAWANGLKNAGYATDLKYPTKLISLIERYQLNQYDAMVLGKPFETNVSKAPENKPIQNNTNTHRVQKGDTLFSLARAHNTTVNELKRINNMQDNALQIGQILKLP